MAAALVLAGPFLLLSRGSHYLPTLRARLTWPGWPRKAGPADRRGGVWLHAVSVGEVGVAATLARRLPEGQPGLVTTITPTGQALAERPSAAARRSPTCRSTWDRRSPASSAASRPGR